MSYPTRLSLGVFSLLMGALAGCSVSDGADGPTSASIDELNLQGRELETRMTVLEAGDPYVPGIDEKPLIRSECLSGAELRTISDGSVLTATVVATREQLARELGIDVGKIGLPTEKLAGMTGAGKLLVKNDFSSRSISVLFRASGDYTTRVDQVDDIPAFAADKADRCGYGYISEARHRVTTALLVTIRSLDDTEAFELNADVTQGDVKVVSGSIKDTLKRGNFDLSITAAADTIEGIAAAPLGDFALFSVKPEDADEVIAKLEGSLDWLAQAQRTIDGHLLAAARDGKPATPTPTRTVRFRFYPGAPEKLQRALGSATSNLLDLSVSQDAVTQRIEAWRAFERADQSGLGYRFNTSKEPASTVADLRARHSELLHATRGKLLDQRDELDDVAARCRTAIENSSRGAEPETDAVMLGERIDLACGAHDASEANEEYLARYDIKPIQFIHAERRHFDEWRPNRMCPAGYHLPAAGSAEAKALLPWSHEADGGVWLAGLHASCVPWQPKFVRDGQEKCVLPFTGPQAVAVCLKD